MPLSDRLAYEAIVDRPKLTLPNNARVAVWVIVNIEEWRIDRAQPRGVLPPPMGKPLVPDVPNWSWHEYGMRVGFWRFLDMLTARDLPVTLCLNGHCIESYPRVTAAARDAGWVFAGHGFVQGPMHGVEDQRKAIADTLEIISTFTGSPCVGWESPGLTETEETADHLAEAGVRWVADWVVDDLPATLTTKHGPLVAMPYTVEINDVVVHAVQQQPSDAFYTRGVDHFDRLYAEGATIPRVMAVSIHPYLTGVPHRIKYVEKLLDHIDGHDEVVFMTGDGLDAWYRKAAGIG